MEEQAKFFDMPEEVDLLNWRDYGRKLMGREFASKRNAELRQWFLGDWLLAGINKKVLADGKKALGLIQFWYEAKKITGYPRGTLKNFVWIAKEFPPSRRRDKLSWSHHREVARLPAVEQDKFLDSWIHRGKDGRTSISPLQMCRTELKRDDKDKADAAKILAYGKGERPPVFKDTYVKVTFNGFRSGEVLRFLFETEKQVHGQKTVEDLVKWLAWRGLQSVDGWENKGKAFLKRPDASWMRVERVARPRDS